MSTSIHINAPPAQVYSVLTNFPSWSEWNPLIQPIALAAPAYSFTAGSRLTASLHLPGQSSPIAMHTYFQSVDPPTSSAPAAVSGFSWGGYQGVGILMTHVFYGHHIFELTAEGDGCRFTNRENFSGLAVWLGKLTGAGWYSNLMANTRRGFELMNQALKERVEKQQANTATAAK